MKKLRKATGHILKLILIWDIREHSGGDATRTFHEQPWTISRRFDSSSRAGRSKALSKWSNTTL